MRNLIIILLVSVLGTSVSYSQGIEVGLRDNNFLHANYKSKGGCIAGYEQSLLNVSLKEQSGRLFAGYAFDKEFMGFSGTAYYGTEYTGNWHVYGAFVEGSYRIGRFYLNAILNPHYDTGLDFNFCYQAEADVTLWKKSEKHEIIELCISYGNVPEYRLATNNTRVGLKFTSGNLWVKPMVYLPFNDNANGQKHIRVICSFGWSFSLL